MLLQVERMFVNPVDVANDLFFFQEADHAVLTLYLCITLLGVDVE